MTTLNTITLTTLGLCGALALTLTGCDAPSFVDDDTRLRPDPPPWLLNTSKVLQSEVPGIDPGEKYFMHTQLSAEIIVDQQPVTLDAIWVDGGELRGVLNGDEYGGDDFDGARVHMLDESDPQEGPQLYDIVVEHELDEHDAHFYLLKYGDVGAPPEELSYMCAQDNAFDAIAEQSRMAYLMDGLRFESDDFEDDPGTMLFGCVSSAAGKARKLGYNPDGAVSLNEFRAAVWAITASYCPELGSNTTPGTEFMIYDTLGVGSSQGFGAVRRMEARWDENGATCIGADHRGDAVLLPGAFQACIAQLPTCTAASPGFMATMSG